jgi:integrase
MKRMQPMTDDQLESLRMTAVETGPREAAIVALLTRHFIRASELSGRDSEGKLFGLRTSDVNLKDGTIHVRRLKGSQSNTESFRDDEEARILAEWLKVKPSSLWLFPGRTIDAPLDRKTIYNIYHELCQKAGVPDTCAAPHASRHTNGQRMAEAGAQAKLIQQAAGHKSLASSGQYYEFRRAFVDSETARFLGTNRLSQ